MPIIDLSKLSSPLTYNQLFESIGLEIEEHRLQLPQQRLSQHPHAPGLGNRLTEPNFQTDFSESQEELITNPASKPNDAINHLHHLQNQLTQHLQNDEIIWPLSMPPHLTPDDITFLDTHFERPWYADYRRILIERYGYYQHIMTGIHVNYSIANELIQWLLENNYYPTRQALYFQILKQVSKHRWLITYLFGASPLTENATTDQLLQHHPNITEPVRSWRASSAGFANTPEIRPDFTSFDNYQVSLNNFVTTGALFDSSEYYGPVRIKKTQPDHSVDYLEFRLFDLNPYSDDGIEQTALSVLNLLILDAIFYPESLDNATMHTSIISNDIVALQHPNTPLPINLQNELRKLITHFQTLTNSVTPDLATTYQDAIQLLQQNIESPTTTVSQKLCLEIQNGSLKAFALKQGQLWKSIHSERF